MGIPSSMSGMPGGQDGSDPMVVCTTGEDGIHCEDDPMVVEEDEGEDQGNQALSDLEEYLSRLYLNCKQSALAAPTLFFERPTSVEVVPSIPFLQDSVEVAPSIPFFHGHLFQNSVEGVHIGGAVGSDTAGASASEEQEDTAGSSKAASEEQEEVSTHVGGGAGADIGGDVGSAASEGQEEVSTHVGGGAGGGIGGAVESNREELNQVNTQQVLC